ncbi:MAG: hypothetical protein ABI593_16455 [Betaproteobacteria bacterium]
MERLGEHRIKLRPFNSRERLEALLQIATIEFTGEAKWAKVETVNIPNVIRGANP